MKIALLSDVHANLPALKEVLKDAKDHRVDAIWYLGDFIGYGPYPVKVVEKLQNKKTTCIVGNYDLNVLNFPKKKKKWKGKKHPSKYFLFDWTEKQLSKEVKKILRDLPIELFIEVEGKSFHLVHGSPEGIDDPLAVNTSRNRFVQLAKKKQADVILCGHTHNFFSKTVNGVQFINPGSVGRPFDKDTRASYVLLEVKKQKLKVAHRRLKYDLDTILKRMHREGFPEDVIESIATGQSLDDIS